MRPAARWKQEHGHSVDVRILPVEGPGPWQVVCWEPECMIGLTLLDLGTYEVRSAGEVALWEHKRQHVKGIEKEIFSKCEKRGVLSCPPCVIVQ